MEQVVYQYLRMLNIPVSRKYLAKQVASHPDYPSLLSVSDALEQLGIPHGVARLEQESLETLFPCILHLEEGKGKFIVVKNKSELHAKPNLLKDWNNIVLKAEAPEEVEDEENRIWLAKEKAGRRAMGLFILAVLALVSVGWLQNFSLASILLSATAIVGAILGYLLMAKDLGVTYDAVESFCNAGRATSCDRVLRSDEAILFGWFSLSDAVLSYFAAQLTVTALLIPLAGSAAPWYWALAAAGVFTLPLVAYSLWLQGAKFKTWCRLCLLVAAVLIVQAGLFGWMAAAGVFGLADGSLWSAGLVAGLFLSAGSLVFLLKTRLKEGREAEQAEAAANRVKYNPSVFARLLLQQPQVDCTPFEKELLIGKAGTPVQITMAASLGCSPCKEGFEHAKQLVRMYPNKVNLSIRFSIPLQANGNKADPGWYILGYWLQAIYGKSYQSKTAENLLQDWFELANLNRFREKYPFQGNGESKAIDALVARHSGWFGKANIKGTPTFFVNGYKLSGHYRVNDLRYFVDEFSDQITASGEKFKKAETKQKY